MNVPFEQLLNISGIRVLSVDYYEKKIQCSRQFEGFQAAPNGCNADLHSRLFPNLLTQFFKGGVGRLFHQVG